MRGTRELQALREVQGGGEGLMSDGAIIALIIVCLLLGGLVGSASTFSLTKDEIKAYGCEAFAERYIKP